MKKFIALGFAATLGVLTPLSSSATNYTCQKAGLGKSFFANVKSQVKTALQAANIAHKKIIVKATDVGRDTLTVDDATAPSIPITVTDSVLSFGTIPDIVPPANQPCEVEKKIQVTIIKTGGAPNVVGEFQVRASGRFVKAQ